MYRVDDKTFNQIVSEAIDSIPDNRAQHIKNLAFVVEDKPTDEQLQKNNLKPGQTLLGLYEGIPLTKRDGNYNLVLPDKITIFKNPSEANANTYEQLKNIVQNTVWHEVAHYYGLGHGRINELEKTK